MITLKQLRYALAVEKTLHFKQAAELCHVSQSALSTALGELESQLGLQIFERNNKKVLLTPIGKEALVIAGQIMLQTADLYHLADSSKTPLSFPISVGIIPTVAPYLLPKIFPALNQEFPQAKLNVVEEQSALLVDMVRSGQIDTAILALPYPCDGLLTLEFWQEDFYWVTQKDAAHSQQTEVSSDEITENSLMLLKEGHCLKEHILDICKLSEQSANHGFAATSLNTLIQMVQGNLGTTLIPAMAMDQLVEGNKNIAAVHLQEPSPHRRIAFIFRPNYSRLSSIETLAAICKKMLAGA